MKKEGVRYARIPKKVFSHTHEENRLKLFNSIDLSMYAGTSWPLTIQTIGEKKNKNYLFHLGHVMGKDAASEMKSVLEKKGSTLEKSASVVERLVEVSGFGVILVLSYTPKKEIIIEVEENVMFDLALRMYGKKSLLGFFYAGIYSGFVNTLLDFSSCKLSYTTRKGRDGKTKHIFSYSK